MKITIGALKERIRFLRKRVQDDGTGGWIETWENGDEAWAHISPIVGRDGFHPDDVGGGMASDLGYVKRPLPARYRVIVRHDVQVPKFGGLIWYADGLQKHFAMTSMPYWVCDRQFQCLLVVEKGETL